MISDRAFRFPCFFDELNSLNNNSEQDHVNVKIVQFIALGKPLSEKSVAIGMNAKWKIKTTV